MKDNKVFMAFASGKETTEGTTIKRYIGVAPVFVLGVNPTKAKMEEMLNISLDEEPNYVGEIDNNGTKVPNVRISFYIKPDANKVGLEVSPINMAMFLRKEFRFNKDNTKVQVIDKYGRTAWVTKEQCNKKEIPIYSNGQPAKIDSGYRPAYVGEENLVNFLKCYLNIPNVDVYNSKTGVWSTHENPTDCEAGLECIENYFKGDFSELQNIISMRPNNKVKVLFGVKTTDDGKQYQAVYTEKFLKNNVSDYSKLDEDVLNRKNAGAYSNVEFSVVDFKEYTVEPTDFTSSNDLPDSGDTSSPWFK